MQHPNQQRIEALLASQMGTPQELVGAPADIPPPSELAIAEALAGTGLDKEDIAEALIRAIFERALGRDTEAQESPDRPTGGSRVEQEEALGMKRDQRWLDQAKALKKRRP